MRPEVSLIFFLFIGQDGVNAGDTYSKKCPKESFWVREHKRCERCDEKYPKAAGYEFAPNCGQDDYGGQPEEKYRPCGINMFNNGSTFNCQPCKTCSPEQPILAPCISTRDTQCCEKGKQVINQKCQHPATKDSTSAPVYSKETTSTPVYSKESTSTPVYSKKSTTAPHSLGSSSYHHIAWIVAVLLLIPVCVFVLICKVKKGCNKFRYITASDDDSLTSLQNGKSVNDLLALNIQEAPLQTVLDNLDILEELIMLLDPDSSVAKTTRHVATRCYFSATWINYAYSMRESKSPLKAVLEGVTTRFPDWTVGHLAKVFNEIGRNDAVAVLGKLSIHKEKV